MPDVNIEQIQTDSFRSVAVCSKLLMRSFSAAAKTDSIMLSLFCWTVRSSPGMFSVCMCVCV